jgi:hypothetical protein
MSTISPPQPVPRKSRRRRYYLGGFLLILVATPVGYYFVAGWMQDRELEAIYRELDADDPNWRWNDLIAETPPPPDERNAALQVLKVHELLQTTGFTPPSMTTAVKYRNARFNVEEAQLLRSAFSKVGPGIVDEGRKLKVLPDGRFPMKALDDPLKSGSGIEGDILVVMRLLQHDARLLAHDGKIAEAAESCQALLNAVHALDGYPAFMAFIIRSPGRVLALDAVERTLANGVVSKDRLRALQTALQREAESNALYHAFRGERAVTHEFFLQIKAGKISHSEMLGGLKTRVPTRFYDLFPSLLLRSHGQDLRSQTEQVHASKLRDEAQTEALQAVDKKLKKSGDVTTPFMQQFVGQLTENERCMQAQLRCAILAVAAERYRLERGTWPRGADELVKAGMLGEVLKDPYGGQALLWKRTTTGVIVHSIGPDKIDHGGKLSRGTGGAGPATNWGFELWAPEYRGVPAPAEAEK